MLTEKNWGNQTFISILTSQHPTPTHPNLFKEEDSKWLRVLPWTLKFPFLTTAFSLSPSGNSWPCCGGSQAKVRCMVGTVSIPTSHKWKVRPRGIGSLLKMFWLVRGGAGLDLGLSLKSEVSVMHTLYSF